MGFELIGFKIIFDQQKKIIAWTFFLKRDCLFYGGSKDKKVASHTSLGSVNFSSFAIHIDHLICSKNYYAGQTIFSILFANLSAGDTLIPPSTNGIAQPRMCIVGSSK